MGLNNFNNEFEFIIKVIILFVNDMKIITCLCTDFKTLKFEFSLTDVFIHAYCYYSNL